MKDLVVLFTSVGNLAFPTAPNCLRRGFPGCKIIGTDVRRNAHGLYFCDKAFIVGYRDTEDFMSQILQICNEEGVNVLFPLSTGDQNYFSVKKAIFQERGIRVICSDQGAVSIANNKFRLYQILRERKIGHPQFYVTNTASELFQVASKLGYPENPVVIKSWSGTGGDGVWILSEDESQLGQTNQQFFIERQQLVKQWQHLTKGKKVLICEYLKGDEYSVDILSRRGTFVYGVVRKRYQAYRGLSVEAEVVKDNEVLEYAKTIVGQLSLSFINNIQIRKDTGGVPKIMEINPRIPGSLSLSIKAGPDFVCDAIRLAFEEEVQLPHIEYGVKMLRFWDGVYLYPHENLLVKEM